jgi:hypothetical protein
VQKPNHIRTSKQIERGFILNPRTQTQRMSKDPLPEAGQRRGEKEHFTKR